MDMIVKVKNLKDMRPYLDDVTYASEREEET